MDGANGHAVDMDSDSSTGNLEEWEINTGNDDEYSDVSADDRQTATRTTRTKRNNQERGSKGNKRKKKRKTVLGD